MLTVYGAKGSGSVPVEAALTLAGQSFQVVEAAVWDSLAEQEKVAAVNPIRQIPAVVLDDGRVLTESAAILIWIADAFPQASLGPRPDDPRRGAWLRWLVYVSAAIYSLYWIRDDPMRLADNQGGADLILDRTSERISHCWAMMDAQIEPGRFLLGDEIGVLDLYVAVVSRWAPRRTRFYQVAPKMAAVVRRVDVEPRLQDLWGCRMPLDEGEQAV